MINLLKNWMSPFAEPRGALSLLTVAAGLSSLPACAEESAQVSSPTVAPQTEQLPAGFTEKSTAVNGVRISYKIGGTGPAVVLLHGYTETSHMWLPVMPLLAKNHTVIAPDLRGAGDSERPEGGYDKKTMARTFANLSSNSAKKKSLSLGMTSV